MFLLKKNKIKIYFSRDQIHPPGMKRYVVNMNSQPNGDHEVHESSCYKLPSYQHQKDLGYHFSGATAVTRAREFYSRVNGCYHCNRNYHTSQS